MNWPARPTGHPPAADPAHSTASLAACEIEAKPFVIEKAQTNTKPATKTPPERVTPLDIALLDRLRYLAKAPDVYGVGGEA